MSGLDELPDPLGSLLNDAPSEARIQRLWRGVQGRWAPERRTSPRRPALVAGLALVLAIGVWLGWGREAPGPLRLADGGAPVAVLSGTDQRIEADDGSTVHVTSQARWVPTLNTASRFESEVINGRVAFHVRPHGPRVWLVRAGTTRIEVLGTEFVVDVRSEATSVRVSRGVVAVFDPGLEQPRRLYAGDEVHIRSTVRSTIRNTDTNPTPLSTAIGPDAAEQQTSLQNASPGPSQHVPDAIGPTSSISGASSDSPLELQPRQSRPRRSGAPVAPRRTHSEASSWRTLAHSGEHGQAYARLGREGLHDRVPHSSPSELMLLADIARLSGHPAEAIAPLERLVEIHAPHPQAALGAVLLGRIEMNALRHPHRARIAFQRALEMGLPAALREDVERTLSSLEP